MLNLKDIAFVPSVQHTGTWFTIDFLKNFFFQHKELTFALEKPIKHGDADCVYEHKYEHPLDQRTIMSIHLPIARYLNFDVGVPQTRFEQKWFTNLATLRSISVSSILMMCNFFKTVIPIRDPIAAILTRETRHPQFRHFYIVDGYVALATEFAKHPNVMFLPIDMTDDITIRHTKLIKVLQHLEIDPAPHGALLTKWATEWPVSNATPGNRLKKLYDEGDIDQLKHLLGPKWAEIEYFRNMSAILVPFLAKIGYPRERFCKGI